MSDHMDTLKGIPALLRVARHMVTGNGRPMSRSIDAKSEVFAIDQGLLIESGGPSISYLQPSKRGWMLVAAITKVEAIPPHLYHRVYENAGEM